MRRQIVFALLAGLGLLAPHSPALAASKYVHSADYSPMDMDINLSELLRAIQFYNSGEYSCDPQSEDGYTPGPGDRTCTLHDSDYNAEDWKIELSELLRAIQFYNSGGYHPALTTEDGFAPGLQALDWFRDVDRDGYSDGTWLTQPLCPPDHFLAYDLKQTTGDCDDTNPSLHGGIIWWQDADGDGHGGGVHAVCMRPGPDYFLGGDLSSTGGDCDDNNPTTHPGAEDICDGVDSDCDALTADGSAYPAPLNPKQGGVCAGSRQICLGVAGWGEDYTSIPEYETDETTCDGLDNDCDMVVDENLLLTFCRDADQDTFGTTLDTAAACTAPLGYVPGCTDCDDTDPKINPATVWWRDEDGDRYSDETSLIQCLHPPDHYLEDDLIAPTGDCIDQDPSIHPGAPEICGDGIDQDCDGEDLRCPPTACIAPVTTAALAGGPVTLDGSCSMGDGSPLEYAWTVSDPNGSPVELTNPQSATPSFTPSSAGDHVVELVVHYVATEPGSPPATLTIRVYGPLWIAPLGTLGVPGVPQGGPAVGSDGSAYAVTYDGRRSQHHFVALDPSGAVKWTLEPSGVPYLQPATDSAGAVYVATSADQTLRKLDPDSGDDLRPPTVVPGVIAILPPVVRPDDWVCIVGWNGVTHVLHVYDPEGNLQWTRDLGRLADNTNVVSGPDGSLYFLRYFTAGVFALNSDGTPKWTYSFVKLIGGDYPKWVPAVGADGTVYVHLDVETSATALVAIGPSGVEKWRTGNLGLFGTPVPVGASGLVYSAYQGLSGLTAFDQLDGGTVTTIGAGGTTSWLLSGAGSRGEVYASENTNNQGEFLHAVSPLAEINWSYTLVADATSAPVIGRNGDVYLATTADWVYRFLGLVLQVP